jgi:hypothetical protein
VTVHIERADGETAIRGDRYRLVVGQGGSRFARLEMPIGRPLADLVLMSSVHPRWRIDELLSLSEVAVAAAPDGSAIVTQSATSSAWESKTATLHCHPDRLTHQIRVRGAANVAEVQLFESGDRDGAYLNRHTLSGWWRPTHARRGWLRSRWFFDSVWSPAPNGAARIRFWPGERATNHPANDADFWGGDWFFTPAPFAYGLGGGDAWLMAALSPRADQLGFDRFDYRGGEGWGLSLVYGDGPTVDGEWAAPALDLIPANDPYDGVREQIALLERRGLVPPPGGSGEEWWRQPIWCGWGEQVARETADARAAQLSTQANYEQWLALLESKGIEPGTIVVDDRWQAHLGWADPSARWPDLGGFITSQHERGRRVLLWHNAWECEAELPAEGAIRRLGEAVTGAFGHPLWDPTSQWFARHIEEYCERLLAPPPRGLGADGLKLDIIHGTPLGPGLQLAGDERGHALLHRLLRLTHEAARAANPRAMVESHAINPHFRDTCGVARLNDVFTDLASVVEQMAHRARVARASGFEIIDTDCWTMPTRAALIEYIEAQPLLGIPSLYYARRVDRSGEELRDQDFARIASVWAGYRGGNRWS